MEINEPFQWETLNDVVQKWYANFVVDSELELLMKLALAADQFHIQPLLDLTCATIMSRGEPIDEFERVFTNTELPDSDFFVIFVETTLSLGV